jgi:hypothetical protein
MDKNKQEEVVVVQTPNNPQKKDSFGKKSEIMMKFFTAL